MARHDWRCPRCDAVLALIDDRRHLVSLADATRTDRRFLVLRCRCGQETTKRIPDRVVGERYGPARDAVVR